MSSSEGQIIQITYLLSSSIFLGLNYCCILKSCERIWHISQMSRIIISNSICFEKSCKIWFENVLNIQVHIQEVSKFFALFAKNQYIPWSFAPSVLSSFWLRYFRNSSIDNSTTSIISFSSSSPPPLETFFVTSEIFTKVAWVW